MVDFHVTFPPGEWERLLTSREEPALRWVRCSFAWEGESFPEAACRRKGNMFDWDQVKKPQFMVRFNHSDPQGRFRGLRRLNFEAFEGLDAPIRDRVGMWLMRQSGLDAPRVNHVRVWKDGSLLGVYMNVEVIDREFLEDHFGAGAADGNLWDSGEELETNEAANDRARLDALEALIQAEPEGGDHSAFHAKLATMMDVSQVLRVMAAETALLTNDNFSNGARNYYYYEHPQRGFLVLPWDLDSVLTESPVDADPFAYFAHHRPLRLRLLINANPAWRAEYVANLVAIRDHVLVRVPAEVEAICAQIREAVRADPNRLASVDAFEVDCRNVRARAEQRAAALRRLLRQ